MPLLGVNIDHVATLRQLRKVNYPDPIIAAKLAQDSGADQITCHLREDRRHIQDADIPKIQSAIAIPLNLEMAATAEMKAFAIHHHPQKVTLVPEKRQELTTEGGLDVASDLERLRSFVGELKKKKIHVALFIDPTVEQIEASQQVGADSVEIHTGNYCDAVLERKPFELDRVLQAACLAKKLGFYVAAGHGLNYENILPFKKITEIQEYNIGHSIVAHAVIVGWERAVREMKGLVR